MNIVAQTLDRDVDQYSEYNVLENSSARTPSSYGPHQDAVVAMSGPR